MCKMFGGPSSGEKSALQSQTNIGEAMFSNYQQQYQQQQAALSMLQAQIGRIQSGQTGPGYSGQENADRIALIRNTSAAEARNAIQATRSLGAGSQVSPTGGMTRQSGINQQVAAQIQSKFGANEANQLIAENVENYATGRENAMRTAGALQALSGDYNPLGYSNAASSSNAQQFKMSQTINQEEAQRSQAIAGLITKAALGAATFGVGGIGALGAGESLGEGASDFFKGGMNALSGTNFSINGPSNPQQNPWEGYAS